MELLFYVLTTEVQHYQKEILKQQLLPTLQQTLKVQFPI